MIGDAVVLAPIAVRGPDRVRRAYRRDKRWQREPEPGYRFWPFQFIESGIFVVLAAVLIAVTFLVVRRRDA
jgi:hypothetical protein